MKTIHRIVRDVASHWVGDGFPVRSLFSYNQDANLYDPFLLLDYGGPYTFTPSEALRGVGEHPHRGFETVTIVYQGELEHRDSTGSQGRIGPGDVQWMTAASGVVHEEFHSERFSKEGGVFEMVQLWVNLPAKDKMTPPHYQSLLDSQIPQVMLPGGAGVVRVIAGEFQGARGPAKTFTPIQVWDLQLTAAAPVELRFAEGHTTLLIVQTGSVQVNDTPVKAVELVSFDRAGDLVVLRPDSPSQVLILSGEPLHEPVVGQGPFVMNTRQQIHEAIQDYRDGRMGHLS